MTDVLVPPFLAILVGLAILRADEVAHGLDGILRALADLLRRMGGRA